MRSPPKTSVTYGLLESLGQAIVTGEYEGRSFPTEAELSERYRASRIYQGEQPVPVETEIPVDVAAEAVPPPRDPPPA